MTTFIKSDRGHWTLIGIAVIGLVIFALALAFLMVPYSTQIEEAGAGDLTCLHVPFTVERAAAVIDTYDAELRAAAVRLHWPGDAIFPIGYALHYGALIALIARRQEGRWLRVGLVVMFLPAVAAVLDWTENAHIVAMIRIAEAGSTADIPAWMPLTGGIAGSIKYLCLSVIPPLYGVLAIIAHAIRDRGRLPIGAWVTYGIAAALLVFSFSNIASGLPPCFG